MDSISSELLCTIHRLECADVTQLDQRTRKLMTMHNAHHSKNNVDRVYIPRKKGCRGLQGVEETKNLKNLGLENYVKEYRAFSYCYEICEYCFDRANPRNYNRG